jgi:hypothetical protein
MKQDRKSARVVQPESTPEAVGFELTPPQISNRVGRRRGRHSSPDFQQCSVWLNKKTRLSVDLGLSRLAVRDGKKKQFSTLVEELLLDWLSKQKETED